VSIARVHKAAGHKSLTSDEAVRLVNAGIRRTIGTAQRAVRPTVTGAETPRLAGAMGYDAPTRQLLCVSSGPTSNATWVWPGLEWRSLGSRTDLFVAQDRMAYDDATRQLILLRSFASLRSTVDDMLTWTGKTCSKQSATAMPTPRYSATLAYDARTRQLLLFGGEDTSTLTTYNDTWDWTGKTWERLG
jgi:hypothetical protein